MPLVSSRDRNGEEEERSFASIEEGCRRKASFSLSFPLSLLAETRKVFRKTIKRDTRDHETLNRGDRVLPSPYAS